MGLEARTPAVSVIIPTHSRPRLLPRAVESARAAGTSVEVVVVDDGSTDETAEVCRALAGVKCVRLEQNQGVASARNVGLLASSAPFVAFLDDDDLRLPGSLDLQVAALESNSGAGFSCGAMLLADQGGRLTGEASEPNHESGDLFWPLLELDFPVMPISVVIRRECFSRVGLFDNSLSGIDDWDMLVRIAELYPAAVSREPVSIYRKPTPSSGQGSSAQARHLSRAARHQLRLLGLPRAVGATAGRRREARRRALERLADTLLLNAAQAICGGAYGFACANTLAALRLSPRRALRPAGYVKLASMLRARAGPRNGPAG